MSQKIQDSGLSFGRWLLRALNPVLRFIADQTVFSRPGGQLDRINELVAPGYVNRAFGRHAGQGHGKVVKWGCELLFHSSG